jgi:hypothetical protein
MIALITAFWKTFKLVSLQKKVTKGYKGLQIPELTMITRIDFNQLFQFILKEITKFKIK